MKLGLALDYFDPRLSASANFELCRRLVAACRDAGFHLIYQGHRFMEPRYVQFQPVPLTARLAAEAGDMAILCGDLLPLNHPVRVAESLATLDVITGGRAMLLAVTGYDRREFDTFGVTRSERGARVRESYEIIARLLLGERVTFASEHYRLDDVQIGGKLASVSDPRPAIWGTGHRGLGLRRVAAHADAWFMSHQPTLTELREQVAEYAQRRADREPRDFHRHESHGIERPLLREAFVARTAAEALAVAEGPMMDAVAGYLASDQMTELVDPGSYAQPFHEWRRERAVIGDPEQVLRDIESYRDALGVDCVVLKLHRAGIPFEQVLAAIALVGDEVIPHCC